MLDYLPPYVDQGDPTYPFTGPYLTNSKGMRAFTFFNAIILNGLPGTALTAKSRQDGKVVLSWIEVIGAKEYVLERKYGDAANFIPLTRTGGNIFEWIDEPGESAAPITYRLIAVNDVTESGEPAYAEVAPTLILGAEPDAAGFFEIFPNPALRGEEVTVQFDRPQTGNMHLIGLNGQFLLNRKVSGSSKSSLILPKQLSGMHLIRFESNGSFFTRKLWIR